MSGSFTLIGGDNRFLYVAEYLKSKGFSVNRIYNNNTDGGRVYNMVILPVPVLRNGFLNAPQLKRQITAEQLVGLLPEKSTVYGGMISDELYKTAEEKGIKLIDYYKDEQLLGENAFLTAKAVSVLLGQEKISVGNGKIFILGFGRCGKNLCRVLTEEGGSVTVVTSRFAEYDYISFDELYERIGFASLIINTVPSPVLGEKELKKVNKNATLIEIASAPYGIDFDAAKRLGINTIKASALPGRFFPKEAGEAIAKTVLRR